MPEPKQNKTSDRNEAFNGILSDGRIFEAIYNPELSPAIQFVIASPGGEAAIQESVVDGSVTKYPPQRQSKWIETDNILLASVVADSGDRAALLQSIKTYLQQYLDLPPYDISLMAHYAMMTWVWDAFNAFPYLRFKGEPTTGKTRCLEVSRQLCYRATDLGGASSKSAIFRIIDKVRGTMLIDESDYNADLRSDLIKLLNVGYRKDGKHSVSSGKGDEWIPEIYNVGCPKILANREDFPDRALETRCLTIHTQSKKLKDGIPIELPTTFFSDGLALRNQLLRWRIDTLRTIDKNETNLRHLDGRVIQLALPLYSISPDARFKRELLRRLTAQSEELRERAPLRIVLEAILRVREDRRRDIISIASVRECALHLARQRDVSESEFTSRKVSELAKKGLGFKAIDRNTGAHILADKRVLSAHCEHLGLGRSDDGDDGDAAAKCALEAEAA